MVPAGYERKQVVGLKKGCISVEVKNGYKNSFGGITFLPFIMGWFLFIE